MNTNEKDHGQHAGPERPDGRGPLVATRRASVVPVRTPEAAWAAVTTVIGDTLAAGAFAGAEEVRAACGRLRPLARYLFTMHYLDHRDGGRLELSCAEDWRVVFTFVYGGRDPDDDLSVPPVAVRGPLAAATVPALTFHSTGPREDPFLAALLDAVNREGVLAARVVPAAAEPAAAAPAAVTPAPAATPDTREEASDARHD
jgi:hypothetical protein